MNIKLIIGSTFFCLILLFSTVTKAAVVTWTFGGTIIGNGGGTTEPVPGINTGDPVSGTVVYNTNASPTDLAWGATLYELTMPTDVLIIEVNGLTFSSVADGLLQAVVLNDLDNRDRVTVGNQTIDSYVHVNIQDEIAPFDLISEESLPTYLDFTKADEMFPDGAGGNYGTIQIGFTVGSIQNATFSIDSFNISSVPVPPAVYLFGSGLIGLIGVARRKVNA